MENPSVRFPQPESVGPREWGHEVLLALAPQKYTMKMISMRAGTKGGLQKHHLKDEAGIVTSGQIKVYYDNGRGGLSFRFCTVGDVFHFPAGAVHQIESVTNSTYIECSTPHFNDRVHVESEYGIEKEDGGLPSTELHEVEIR